MPDAYQVVTAVTQFIEAAGVRYAYRWIGDAAGPPLVMFQRFGGSMDDWDAAFIEGLAAQRRVLLFDNAGVGRSTGETPDTFAGVGHAAGALFDGLGLKQVDVLGWSMGGYMASHFVSERPDLARRLVLAASGTGYLAGAPVIPSGAPTPSDPDAAYLLLNFWTSDASQAAGRAHLARTKLRPDRLAEALRPESAKAFMAARALVMSPEGSLMPRFPAMTLPVLIANGAHDERIPPYYAFVASQTLPNAKLVLYPDAGHGFAFQHMDAFVAEVLGFLA